MDRLAAIVLAGGRCEGFGALSDHRTKAAFPVAGYYRICDFVLSNLCHAGVRQAGIIIQYMPASLMEHIGSGRPWEFDMADRALRFMTPFVGVNEIRWFHGTGDAIGKNLNLISQSDLDDILVLSSDHVYRMDYRPFVEYHRSTGADITLACAEIPPECQHPRFGNIIAGEDGRVQTFAEKPGRPISSRVFLGIYCFRRTVLRELLARAEEISQHGEFSLPRDVVQPHIGEFKTYAWLFQEPWYYLADLQEYYDFHMRLARGELPMFDHWNVITNYSDRNLGSRTPAFFAPTAEVASSLITSGCRIEGTVSGSMLCPGVQVARGAVVRDSVLFHDVRVGEGCRIERAIVDKDVVLERGAKVGPASRGDKTIAVVPKGFRLGPGEHATAETLTQASHAGVGAR